MTALLTIAMFHLLAVISPGPDFAMTVKNSIMYSRKSALYTSLGIAIGIWVHVIYCVLGLAIVISKSILLFNVIKYLGAFYLMYLGTQALLSKKTISQNGFSQSKLDLTTMRAIKQGFLCNLLNPKATLFFLSLFTLVIDPHTPIWLQLLYGLEMFVVTFLWFAFLSTVITNKKIKGTIGRVQVWVTKCMGGLLILFGIKLAFSKMQS